MLEQSIDTAPLSEEVLTRKAEQLARLRNQVAACQARTGAIDPTLLAEFAEIQRTFIHDTIHFEQLHIAGSQDEQPRDEKSVDDQTSRGETKPPAADTSSSPPPQEGTRLLEASPHFWLTVIILLSAFVTFLHSPFSYQ